MSIVAMQGVQTTL